MDIVLTTPPSENEVLELVSVAKLKRNERISHTEHDYELLPDCIKQAYAFLDGEYGWLNRSILTQTWTMYLSCWEDEIELPKGPVQSVTHIKYYAAGVSAGDSPTPTRTVLPASYYELQNGKIVPTITRAYGKTYPSVGVSARAIEIQYVAGWGVGGTIPFGIRAKLEKAILLLASQFYRNPAATFAEPRIVAVDRKVLFGLENIVGMLRIPPDHR